MGLSRRRRGPLPGRRALETLALTVCLGVCIQGAAAAVTNTGVGEAVTLPAPFPGSISSSSWYKGTAVTPPQLICNYLPALPSQIDGPQYTGRETCQSDGSLVITNPLTNYTGNYTVTAQPTTAAAVTITTELKVYEMVPKPLVTSEPSPLRENRPAEITCNASTAATTILWSFNKGPNLPANIIPSSNNRTLSIANVSLEDSGTYQCVAMNPVSSNASDPVTLTVAFGPENVKIDPPGPLSVQIGTALSLKCTAESIPAAWYQWSLNGTELMSTKGIVDVSSLDNRTYTCVAYNNVTGLTAKASVSIVVLEFFPTVAPKPEVLSGGAIAGIVIAALVVVAGVAALVYFFVFKKPASGAATEGNTTEMAPKISDGSANGTAAEIQYSSVNFVPKRGTTEKPIAPENTVYSEVRR